jgi:hypothetical protein
MAEKLTFNEVFGPGGYDSDKKNNNRVEAWEVVIDDVTQEEISRVRVSEPETKRV